MTPKATLTDAVTAFYSASVPGAEIESIGLSPSAWRSVEGDSVGEGRFLFPPTRTIHLEGGEWSGEIEGAPSGPMWNPGDGPTFDACPLCKRCKPFEGVEREFRVWGHAEDCPWKPYETDEYLLDLGDPREECGLRLIAPPGEDLACRQFKDHPGPCDGSFGDYNQNDP